MKQTKITVGIACLIMSSSFAALAGGPAPVVKTSDSHAWTIYMNVNGALSTRTGKNNESGVPLVKDDAWTLGGGVNVGIAGKLTNQVNAFTQLSVDQFTDDSLGGYRFEAYTNDLTTKDNTVRLDKAYVNWNTADRSMVIQAGDMGMIDMSTFTQSNLNAWSPITMGFDINSVTDLFGNDVASMATIGARGNQSTFNERGAGFGYHGFGHLYATVMYGVFPANATSVTPKTGFFGKNSGNTLQGQLAWKTNNWVAAVNYVAPKTQVTPAVADPKRSQGFNVEGAYRLGKLVFSAQYDHGNDKTQNPAVKTTWFGAGASYNLDLFGFNHTWQVQWLNSDNGKGVNEKSNTFQVNDIVPVFNKHVNIIPFFVTTDNMGGVKNMKRKNNQFGVLFQGLWSVNV